MHSQVDRQKVPKQQVLHHQIDISACFSYTLQISILQIYMSHHVLLLLKYKQAYSEACSFSPHHILPLPLRCCFLILRKVRINKSGTQREKKKIKEREKLLLLATFCLSKLFKYIKKRSHKLLKDLKSLLSLSPAKKLLRVEIFYYSGLGYDLAKVTTGGEFF